MKKYIYSILFIGAIALIFAGCTNALTPPKQLNEYNMTLNYNKDNKVLSGEEEVSYVNKTDVVLKEIWFHLYPNAFRENAKATVVSLLNYNKAYYKGKSYGDITVSDVSQGNSKSIYEIGGEDNNILKVSLNHDLYPNDRAKIKITFSVKLANVNHRLGYGENTVNLCNFYPIACMYEDGKFIDDLYNSNGDPFYSEISNYNVKMTYDNNLMLASSGVQKTSEESEKITSTITANKIRDFAMTLSSKFSLLTQTVDGIELKFYYYTKEFSEKANKAFAQIVALNNSKIGKYPYAVLSVVEANFVHGGMEYPNIVLISDELGDVDTFVNVVVHEVTHQWWYGIVGNNQFDNGWIDEGLTDFYTALFYDSYPEYGLNSGEIFRRATNSFVFFVDVYSGVYGKVDTSMNRALNEFSTEAEYVNIVYTKAALLFASLRELLGVKVFDKAIVNLYDSYAFKEITSEQLIASFEKSTKFDLESFFDAWISGKVVISNFI